MRRRSDTTDSVEVSIGAAAARAGVNVQTLRYYERRGLLRRPPRDASSGYRRFGADAVADVMGIKHAQRLGFSLAEIRELLALRSVRSPERLRALTTAKLREIDDKLRGLRRMRSALQEVLETCACRGDVTRCRVLAADEDDDQHRARRSTRRPR